MRPDAPSRRILIALGAVLTVVVVVKIIFIWVVVPFGVSHGYLPEGGRVRDLYFDIALNVAAGDGFRLVAGEGLTMVRGPGYVYFLAGLVRLFGEGLTAPLIANLVLATGTMILTFVLARRVIASDGLAVLAAAVTGLHPGTMLLDARINVETFFTFFLCLFVLLLGRAFSTMRTRDFVPAGLALGLVSLSRSVPVFGIPLIFLYLLYVHRTSRPVARAVQMTAVLTVTSLLVLSPWMIRNYAIGGKPTFSESLVGVAAFCGQYTTRTVGTGVTFSQRNHDATALQKEITAAAGVPSRPFHERNPNWDVFPSIEDELAFNRVLVEEVLRNFADDWTLLPRHLYHNAVRFWFVGTTPKVTMLGAVVQVPLVILALIGAVIGIRRRLPIAPMLLVILTLFTVHLPLVSHARYSIPTVPFLAILAMIAVVRTPLARWAPFAPSRGKA